MKEEWQLKNIELIQKVSVMNHIEFMGIPLEGTSKEFFTKLKSSAQIYSVEKESDNEVKCQLSFTGKWAHVIISGNPVYWISVELHYGYGITDPTIEEWNQIVDDYYDYKDFRKNMALPLLANKKQHIMVTEGTVWKF